MVKQKMIKVSPEFHEKLASHGRFGERFEDILIRLLGKEFINNPSGDNKKKIDYSKDIDSKKYKEKRRKANVDR